LRQGGNNLDRLSGLAFASRCSKPGLSWRKSSRRLRAVRQIRSKWGEQLKADCWRSCLAYLGIRVRCLWRAPKFAAGGSSMRVLRL